ARHLARPRGRQRKAVAVGNAGAAHIGGLNQRRASGIELSHLCIRERMRGRGKGGASRGRGGTRGRKVGGPCASRHVDVAGGVQGDAAPIVNAAAAQVGRVAQGRINDERPAYIVIPTRNAS